MPRRRLNPSSKPRQFVVTHYTRRHPSPDGLQELPIITRVAGSPSESYFGFEPDRRLTPEEVQGRTTSGLICKLSRPHLIDCHQSLWLCPNGDVVLASSDDPIHDPLALVVDNGAIRRTREDGASHEINEASPNLRVIGKSGVLWRSRGDYANSRRAPNQTVRTAWISRYEDRVAQRASDVVGHLIRCDETAQQEHDYGNIASLIRMHQVQLCTEFIMKDENRAAANIEIVNLGQITHYALVCIRNSDSAKRIWAESDDVWDNERPWWNFVHRKPTIICGHTETAAANELRRLYSKCDLVTDGGRHFRSSIADLKAWLESNSADGLVVCDVGVAWQLRAAAPDLDIVHVCVRYERPIPFGFAYSAQDPRWGEILQEELDLVVSDPDPIIQASLAETIALMSDIAARWTKQIGLIESAETPVV